MTQQPLLSTSEFKAMHKGKRAKPKKKEENLQLAIAKYLRSQYPGIVFNSDIASGMKLTMGQAVKAKAMRSERGQNDLTILEPKGPYHALCIELKNDISDVYLKDGVTISDAKSNKHVIEQAALLKALRQKGYWADFSFGFDGTKKIIDTYMNL